MHTFSNAQEKQQLKGNEKSGVNKMLSVSSLNHGYSKNIDSYFKNNSGNDPGRALSDFSRVKIYASSDIKPQTKLKINKSSDIYEQEADHVADQVMRMSEPGNDCKCGGSCSICKNSQKDDKKLQPSSFRQNDIDNSMVSPIVNGVLSSSGQPLSQATRSFFESRFGQNFSQVRIHMDDRAVESANAMQARAYTIGNHVVFGAKQFSPGTTEGQRLLAHELTHVLQQRSERLQTSLQRQDIPQELQTSIDLTTLSDEELRERYDLITATLALFSESTPETNLLEQEAGKIGTELGRREALAGGRTFSEESISKMRDYFKQNATKSTPDSCIVCLNKGVKLLLNDPNQKTTPESIEKTMGILQTSGRAGTVRLIEFEDKKGRITKGTLYPEKLHESAWDAVIQMADGDPGWSVFGLSLMDGNHSITLSLDNNIPQQPVIYWSDQWSSKGGWKPYDKVGLDGEITRLTQSWWNDQPQNLKFNTRMRLWRLNQ